MIRAEKVYIVIRHVKIIPVRMSGKIRKGNLYIIQSAEYVKINFCILAAGQKYAAIFVEKEHNGSNREKVNFIKD